MKKKFYITTAIPYLNAPPHIGHAFEFVQADFIARYHKREGYDVHVLSGGDENAVKNVQAAEKAGKPIQEFIDFHAAQFQDLAKNLNVQFDIFQRGSDQKRHFPSSQKLWELCVANGDIYKKEYEGLYCVGCEAFYTKEELDEKGECFEHPGKKLDVVSETNYFFKLSKYKKQVIELIESGKLEIVPEKRKNEALSFLKGEIHDISISRSNKRARNWGVPVPNDSSQRIYVWFDALNIYQSGVGFGWDEKRYKKWWPADIHVIGKGIIRFHAIYWPAFLLSAKLPLPKKLFVHGYLTIDGHKMSKTVGNVVDPNTLIAKYGVDALRYYLLREIPTTDDGDYSDTRMLEIYNADLANGIGNLVSRITTLAEKNNLDYQTGESDTVRQNLKKGGFESHIKNAEFHLALEELWREVKRLDIEINEHKPWTLSGETLDKLLIRWLTDLREIADVLSPFLPETSGKIIDSTQGKIKKAPVLFPRL